MEGDTISTILNIILYLLIVLVVPAIIIVVMAFCFMSYTLWINKSDVKPIIKTVAASKATTDSVPAPVKA